jgi:hypothetical protein
MLSVLNLCVVLLNVVILSVGMLSVLMLNVVVPFTPLVSSITSEFWCGIGYSGKSFNGVFYYSYNYYSKSNNNIETLI